MKKGLMILLLFCVANVTGNASHIVGGTLGYELLGNGPGGTLRYRINLTTYTDCSPSSEIPFPESPLQLGIYFNDISAPQASKILKQTLSLLLDSAVLITPPLPPGCSVGQGSCIYRGSYSAEVLLEPSTQGYHLYYERCCRNTAIINLQNPSQTSTGFYAFIPPSSIPNSSPVFIDDPVPLMCVQDSLYLVNTAYDPDGDLLLYSFTVPYAGFADIMNPAPLPEPVLQWPVNTVVYAGGFSSVSPFGPGGYASINSLSGFSVFKTALIGNFSLAVQVNEYRNGNLISSTRRDMQFVSLVCPVNQAPQANFNEGFDIQMVEGDTACFSFSYTDPDADSVFLSASGEPFTGANPAQLSITQTGPSTVDGEICWTPPCGSARPVPYFMAFSARDNGCLPKNKINMVSITVVPDTAGLNILGDSLVCGEALATYQADKTQGIFTWTLNGGTILSGNGTHTIEVEWNLNPGDTGTIMLIRNGACADDTAYYSVNLSAPQFAGTLPSLWLCPGSTGQVFAEPGGSGYLWQPGNWLSDSTSVSPMVNTPVSEVYQVTYTDSSGCAKFDSVSVTVGGALPVDAGNDFSICGVSPLVLGGNPSGPQNSVYQWTSPGILDNPNSANPQLQFPVTGWYILEVDVDTCTVKDSVRVVVLPLPQVNAGNDTIFCFGNTIQLNGSGTAGQAEWFAGGILDNTGILNPILSVGAGIYFPVLQITDSAGCVASDTLRIEVVNLPVLTLTGPELLCPGDTALLTASGATFYTWISSAYLSAPQLPQTGYAAMEAGMVYLEGRDSLGCSSTDSVYIDVFDVQIILSSDTLICLGDTLTLTASSLSGTNFSWSPPDFSSPSLNGAVNVWPPYDFTYTLTGISNSGCTDSAKVNLYVKQLPVFPPVTYESELFCGYTEISFTAGMSNDSLSWFKETEMAGSGNEVLIQVNTQMPESVYLVAVNEFGCTDTLLIEPDIESTEQQVPKELPNIFTPDADGVNDAWTFELPEGLAGCSTLFIYNRWGALVFKSDEFPLSWQGKTNTETKLNEGVYFYVLETGGVYRKGMITLVR